MKSPFLLLLVTTLLAPSGWGASSAALPSAAPNPPGLPGALASIAPVVKAFESRAPKSQGAAAMVILYKDQVLYKHVLGKQKGKQGPADHKTVFAMASVSKAISASLIAYLVKQHKLSYDEPLTVAYPQAPVSITLRHLLSHGSGLNEKGSNAAIERGVSRDELTASVLARPVVTPPGARYKYSNIAFSLLEGLIAAKTQTPYQRAMQDFLTKLGIEAPQVCQVTDEARAAFPHIRNKAGAFHAKRLPDRYPPTACSASGLFLSADDMTAYLKLMMGYQTNVLTADELSPLFAPQIPVQDIFSYWTTPWPYPVRELSSAYGLGWRLLNYKKSPDNPLIFHSGYLSGVGTFTGLIPAKGISFAVMLSRESDLQFDLGFMLWKQSMRL